MLSWGKIDIKLQGQTGRKKQIYPMLSLSAP